MARKNDEQPIHYSFRTPATAMFAQGTGACCREGAVTGFPGLVTCPTCKGLLTADEPKAVTGTVTIVTLKK